MLIEEEIEQYEQNDVKYIEISGQTACLNIHLSAHHFRYQTKYLLSHWNILLFSKQLPVYCIHFNFDFQLFFCASANFNYLHAWAKFIEVKNCSKPKICFATEINIEAIKADLASWEFCLSLSQTMRNVNENENGRILLRNKSKISNSFNYIVVCHALGVLSIIPFHYLLLLSARVYELKDISDGPLSGFID